MLCILFRYSKVDPIAEKSDSTPTDKENNDTSSTADVEQEKVPVWKRELRRLSSRSMCTLFTTCAV